MHEGHAPREDQFMTAAPALRSPRGRRLASARRTRVDRERTRSRPYLEYPSNDALHQGCQTATPQRALRVSHCHDIEKTDPFVRLQPPTSFTAGGTTRMEFITRPLAAGERSLVAKSRRMSLEAARLQSRPAPSEAGLLGAGAGAGSGAGAGAGVPPHRRRRALFTLFTPRSTALQSSSPSMNSFPPRIRVKLLFSRRLRRQRADDSEDQRANPDGPRHGADSAKPHGKSTE